ncbi:HAD family hydrolase [Paenochrobactrum sp. BZR 588]|uniref:HAD family hydrolase n=1 Tax=Paenochrobactrum TaxID=999488 RepID=UPI0035BBAB81
MSAPKLIIFDCDGVLVDSEIIAAQVQAELLTDAGYEVSAEEMAERFAGLTWKNTLLEVERQSGLPFSASLLDKVNVELDDRLRNEVQIIDDIEDVISALQYPFCIGSNSSMERLKITLNRTGLYDRFAPHIFSAPEVGTKKSKPAPDVFLYAAQQFTVAPKDVIVVEDSTHGVQAARSAGMRVIGFTGGAHSYPGHADQLTEEGAETVINRHKDLLATVEALSIWSDA